MISSVRNFVVRILDADRFTIALFQILDIKSNYNFLFLFWVDALIHTNQKAKGLDN
jgi:hypothetical protein